MKLFGSAEGPRRSRIERLWGPGLSPPMAAMWCALAPPSLAYAGVNTLRAGFWRLFRARAADVKVISVGNLTVGGNAKTPFALYLARKLLERGLRAAIVSRGYGGLKGSGAPALVSDGSKVLMGVEEAGDEALMMARGFAGPVAIARRRLLAIRLLQQLGPLDVVVLDDGFQHLRLVRDLDLLLMGERPLGNGWVLPAGPMRERLGAGARADAIVVVGFGERREPTLSPRQERVLGRLPTLHGLIRPRALAYPGGHKWREEPAETLAARRVLALAAIANTRPFYAMLRELEADLVGVLEYPDHHNYTARDWREIRRAAQSADLIVTTEKDLVKLERFPFARDGLAALRLEVVMEPADEERLLAMALGGGGLAAAMIAR